MRISDWSSDVCSSDLLDFFRAQFRIALERIYDVENLQSGSIQIEPPRDIEFPIAEDVLERDVVGYVERSRIDHALRFRSEEHTSELQSLMRISYAVFCLKKKKTIINSTCYIIY